MDGPLSGRAAISSKQVNFSAGSWADNNATRNLSPTGGGLSLDLCGLRSFPGYKAGFLRPSKRRDYSQSRSIEIVPLYIPAPVCDLYSDQ